MRVISIAVIAALAMCGTALAQNVPPAEERYFSYSGKLPPCDTPRVLELVSFRFMETRNEFWHSALRIDGYDRIREIGLRSNGLSYIPRRYCIARAHLNDNKDRAVIYVIGEKLSMAGQWGDGVTWCVIGLDPSLAYAPNCQALRPIIDTDIVGQGGMDALVNGLLRNDRNNGGVSSPESGVPAPAAAAN